MKTEARAFLRDGALLFAVAVVDQAVKAGVRRAPCGTALFSCGLFSVCREENTGGAFGIFQAHPEWISAASVLLIVSLSVYLYREYVLKRPRKVFRVAWILLFGGGAGNAADRLLRGSVTDYIQLRFIPFPLFNLADVFIVTACLLFVLCILREGRENDQKQADRENPTGGRHGQAS